MQIFWVCFFVIRRRAKKPLEKTSLSKKSKKVGVGGSRGSKELSAARHGTPRSARLKARMESEEKQSEDEDDKDEEGEDNEGKKYYYDDDESVDETLSELVKKINADEQDNSAPRTKPRAARFRVELQKAEPEENDEDGMENIDGGNDVHYTNVDESDVDEFEDDEDACEREDDSDFDYSERKGVQKRKRRRKKTSKPKATKVTKTPPPKTSTIFRNPPKSARLRAKYGHMIVSEDSKDSTLSHDDEKSSESSRLTSRSDGPLARSGRYKRRKIYHTVVEKTRQAGETDASQEATTKEKHDVAESETGAEKQSRFESEEPSSADVLDKSQSYTKLKERTQEDLRCGHALEFVAKKEAGENEDSCGLEISCETSQMHREWSELECTLPSAVPNNNKVKSEMETFNGREAHCLEGNEVEGNKSKHGDPSSICRLVTFFLFFFVFLFHTQLSLKGVLLQTSSSKLERQICRICCTWKEEEEVYESNKRVLFSSLPLPSPSPRTKLLCTFCF